MKNAGTLARMLRSTRVLVLLLAVLLGPAAWAGELRVYFFDVGQGDSALIVSPSGKTVLIDAGPPEARARLEARLTELLHAPLDLAILTHPHLDHLGGMVAALSVKGALAFMDSGFEHPSPQYAALLEYLQAHQIRVLNAISGRTIDLGGGASLTLLGPPKPFFHGTRSDPNANSVVARLTYGTEHFLFSGDAEEETEQMLLREGNLQSDVLKVPHHGSRHSSTEPFLAAVKPKIAVISVGAGNDYGHPTRAALDRLEAVGAKVYRTDLDGEVRIACDGTHLRVESNKASEGAARAQKAEAAPVSVATAYIGSRSSHVFHRAGCTGADRIKPQNRVVFTSRAAAISAGRKPAKDCNP
jgi:competence protein ComEC